MNKFMIFLAADKLTSSHCDKGAHCCWGKGEIMNIHEPKGEIQIWGIWLFCYGSFAMMALLWWLCYCSFATAALLYWLCYGSFSMAALLRARQLRYSRFVLAAFLRQLHYVSFAMSALLCQLCYSSFAMAALSTAPTQVHVCLRMNQSLQTDAKIWISDLTPKTCSVHFTISQIHHNFTSFPHKASNELLLMHGCWMQLVKTSKSL